MSDFTESQLLDLRTRLLPFGAGWTHERGRDLATVRDGIDFLTAMRGRDDFWAALEPRDRTDPYAVDLTAARTLLRAGPEASATTEADCLQSLGLSAEEATALTSEIAAPDLVDAAIRSAFAQGEPQKIARALETMLETDRDVLATQQYMRKLAGSRALVQSLGAVMGIALLLVGTGCGSPASPPPETSAVPLVASTTAPPTTSSTPADSPTAPVTSVPPSAPPKSPSPSPIWPSPKPAYKGVSPRRRAYRRAVPSDQRS